MEWGIQYTTGNYSRLLKGEEMIRRCGRLEGYVRATAPRLGASEIFSNPGRLHLHLHTTRRRDV